MSTIITLPLRFNRNIERVGSNKSVYNYGRNVHIYYLHGVTLSHATAKSSIRLADPA